MVMSNNTPKPQMEFRCGDLAVERVASFKYLGSVVKNVTSGTEITERTGITKSEFGNMKNVLVNRKGQEKG